MWPLLWCLDAVSAPALAPAPAASGEVFLLASRAWLSGSRLAGLGWAGLGWAGLGWLFHHPTAGLGWAGLGGGSHGLTSHQHRRVNHTEQHFSGACSNMYR